MPIVHDVEMKSVIGDQAAIPVSAGGCRLIVEFVGLTGCGKTTNCQHFSDLLNQCGIKAYVFKDVKGFLYSHNFIQRIGIYLNTLKRNSKNLIFYAILLTSHGIFSIDSVKRYVKLLIFNDAVQRWMKTHYVDVLLLDQWIIQGLWSATIFRARSYSSLAQKLPQFFFPVSCLLFFDVREEIACDRIASRNSGRSRFDKMDHGMRLSKMKQYSLYLRQLYEQSDCVNKFRFSAQSNPQENARLFLKHLQSTFHKKK